MQVQSLGREKSPGGGHGNPLRYSCLQNPMKRGAWKMRDCKEWDSTEVAQYTHTSFAWSESLMVFWSNLVQPENGCQC